MTISYNLDVPTASPLAFLKVCLRWKGSVWKNCWKEYSIWVTFYIIVYIILRNGNISPELQKIFKNLIHHLDDELVYIPLLLLLGFFVTFVVDRWKRVFSTMSFIDNVAFTVGNYIVGQDEETITKRRNILRYVCAAQVLLLRDISLKVRIRFPTMESLVQAGILQEHELEFLTNEDPNYSKYATPINWACNVATQLRKEGQITNDTLLNAIFKEINDFQRQLQTLCNFDYIPVPLAYIQVAFCVVRAYLVICLFARQYTVDDLNEEKNVDYIKTLALALMTMLQVFFYLAWIKVAEELLNPLGDGDEDFECNYVIDYNITISMNIAGEFNSIVPDQLTATVKMTPDVDDKGKRKKGYAGSVSKLNVIKKNGKVTMIPHNHYKQMKNNTTAAEAAEINGMSRQRRLTFPLSFKRRKEQFPSEIPELAKQVEIQPMSNEDIYKTLPTKAQDFYDNNSFAETYAYFPQIVPQKKNSEDELPFAKSRRFNERLI